MSRGILLGSVLGLAIGAIGALAVRGLGPDGNPGPAANAPASPSGPSGEVPQLAGVPTDATALRTQLEAAQARIQQLTAELEAARQRASTATPPSLPRKDAELPAAVRQEAARLGVSDRALEAMWRARNAYYDADAATREQILASLRPYGDETFDAVAAILRGGGGHIGVPIVLASLGLPGGGDRLIRMVEEDPQTFGSLLEALAGYDSPKVRDYLVQRIAHESDPAAFWHLAAALGALHEPRGAAAIRLEQFVGPAWAGVRGSILGDIGKMGGPAAVRLLDDYLLLPNADQVGAALGALAALDRESARAHARRLRQTDRYGFLSVTDRIQVDALAGDR